MKNVVADSGIKAVPDREERETSLLNKLNEWLSTDEGSIPEQKWREESEEDYNFYAGDQDDPQVKRALEEANRPVSVFNEIKPKIDMLVGIADQIRKAPTVLPVGTEDEALAELMNGAFKHFRYETGLADKEMECFEHMAKSGRSFLHFYIDTQNPFEPKIVAKRLPGRDVVVDCDSIEYDLSDARRVFIQKWFNEEDIKAIWPHFDGEAIKSLEKGSSLKMPSYFDPAREKYRIVECWYRKWEKVYWFENPLTGRIDMLREPQWKRFVRQLKEGIPLPDGGELQMDIPPLAQPTMKQFVHYAIFSGLILLEAGPSPYRHDSFPLIPFCAYKDENNNRWFGAITALKDPQRALNTMKRQLQHLLQTSPKGILIHEEDALANEEEYDQYSSSPNFRLVLRTGMFDKAKFTDQPQISPVYQYLIGDYSESMKHISGAEDPLLGIQTSSREPGITARMRMESSIAVLFILFNNFRKSRILAGKQLLSLIQQYVTLPRVIRIEGPEGAKLVRINTQLNPQSPNFNDITVGKYDLVVDEAAENVTMRREIANMLLEYARNAPEAVPPEVVMEYLDLPLSVKVRVREYNEARLAREEEFKRAELAAKLRRKQ